MRKRKPVGPAAQPPPPGGPADELVGPLRNILIAFLITAGLVMLVVGLLYVQIAAWQLLGVLVCMGVGMTIAGIAYFPLRRGQVAAAGHLLLVIILVAFVGNELFVRSETVDIIALSGAVLSFVIASVGMPRRWWGWLLASGLVLLGSWLANRFTPWPRLEAAQYPLLRWFVPIAATGALLAVVLQAGRAYRRIGTIHTRLLVTMVATVVFTALAVGLVSALLGQRSGQQQVARQLESVASLKEAEVSALTRELQNDLVAIISEEYFAGRVAALTGATMPYPGVRQQARDRLLERLQAAIERTGRYESLELLDANGVVLLSTEAGQEGKDFGLQRYFQQGLSGPYIQPPTYVPRLGRTVIMVARPVISEDGHVLGVLVGRANLAALDALMGERAGLGETGRTYLVGVNHALLTGQLAGQPIRYVRSTGIDTALDGRTTYRGVYEDTLGVPVIGEVRWLPDLEVALVAEQEVSEALSGVYLTRNANIGVALLVVGLAVLASFALARSIAAPLAELADTAVRIAGGELGRVARVAREDEVGSLARAFNSMTAQLRELIAGLEQRVAERTADLQQRTIQLQTAAQVARDAAEIRDVGTLLDTTVRLISERFGFYHAGIFLLDEAGEYAVLRAASSEGGQRMLARGHKLKVGQVGIVGYVAGSAQPRIALDVGEDAVFFDNPDLPHTRSEMALPLRVRGRVIGVLDVQSTAGGAFGGEDVAILQTMADQLALALENARLLEETQRALNELRVLYGEYVRRGWERLGQMPAFEYDRVQVMPVPPRADPLLEEAVRSGQVVSRAAGDGGGTALVAPLRLGEQVIGAIALEETEGGRMWSEDEIELVQAVSEQVARALESARLYQMEQERRRIADALRDMSRVVSSTLDLQQVIDRLLDQLGRLIPFDTASVQLFHEEGRELIGGRGFDLAAAQAHADLLRPLSEDPLLAEVVARRAPLVIPDTHADPRWEVRQETIAVRSWLAAPLVVGEEVLGALLIDHHTPNLYSEETGELAGTVAAQAAVAIQNARFFAEARRAAEEQERLARLATIASSTLNLEELLGLLVEEARLLVDAETMVLMVLREEENALVGSYISRADHLESLPFEWRIPLDTPGFELSIFSRRGAYYSNMGLQDPNIIPAYRTYMEALNVRNFCGVALLLREQSIGELYAVNRQGGFSRNEVRLMRAVTGYVANAIENARLFQETIRRAERESKITEIVTRIRASTSMEAIVRAAAEELSQALGVARVLVRLGVEAGPPAAADGPAYPQVEEGEEDDAMA